MYFIAFFKLLKMFYVKFLAVELMYYLALNFKYHLLSKEMREAKVF